MGLLRLMHLRKLVPLADLLAGGARSASVPSVPNVPSVPRASFSKAVPNVPASRPAAPLPRAAEPTRTVEPPRTVEPVKNQTSGTSGTPDSAAFKDRFLAEVKSGKYAFYNLVVASAYRIDAGPSGIIFSFLPNQKNAKMQCEEQK